MSIESGYSETGVPGQDEIIFLPLGGTGEIGMNLNLYGHAGKWLMVDLGISFDDGYSPGVDVIMPDPAFIEERREDLVGLVLTHAHEDHLGAVQYLWEDYDCPIYATPFTAEVLRRKLAENGVPQPDIIEIPMSGHVALAPFDIELITLTHSIPEPNALIIRCAAGAVMHTGDWKLDPDPLVGPNADEAALIKAGEDGILAMVCDSTNAMNPGHSGSEGVVRENLVELVSTLEGRVAVACFSSNIARIESAALAARKNGRHVALVGRSLRRMTEAARETGYLTDVADFISEEAAAALPPEQVLLICTGSQGEPRAALSRIARDDHQTISLGEGDTVIFSSREIPGNEVGIGRLQNQLTELGCTVVTARDQEIHTSGHPNQDELAQMYQWIRPKIAVPVHGERRHLTAHAELAQRCQVPHTIVAFNGDVMRLHADEGVTVVDEVYAGRLALDGERIVPFDNEGIRERRRVAWNGCAVASVAVNRKGVQVGPAEVTVFGLFDSSDRDRDGLVGAVERAVAKANGRARADDRQLSEAVRVALRRELSALTGKRPPVSVHLLRVD